jgi:hypothetical protein
MVSFCNNQQGADVGDLAACMTAFTRKEDGALVAAVNSLALQPKDLNFSDSGMLDTSTRVLAGLSRKQLTARLHVLAQLNSWLLSAYAFELVDWSLAPRQSALTDLIRANRHIIFTSSKTTVWSASLKATETRGTSFEVKVDRLQSARAHENALRMDKDYTSETVFGQMFTQLRGKSPSMFRIKPNDRAWKVSLVGMRASDAGGPYRDCIEEMCKELMSPSVSLFVRSPNQRAGMGDNQECFVPRSSVKQAGLAYFEFLGQILGLSLRSRFLLPLALPPLMWKLLVGEPVSATDLTSIDVTLLATQEKMLKLSAVNFSDYSAYADLRMVHTSTVNCTSS